MATQLRTLYSSNVVLFHEGLCKKFTEARIRVHYIRWLGFEKEIRFMCTHFHDIRVLILELRKLTRGIYNRGERKQIKIIHKTFLQSQIRFIFSSSLLNIRQSIIPTVSTVLHYTKRFTVEDKWQRVSGTRSYAFQRN